MVNKEKREETMSTLLASPMHILRKKHHECTIVCHEGLDHNSIGTTSSATIMPYMTPTTFAVCHHLINYRLSSNKHKCRVVAITSPPMPTETTTNISTLQLDNSLHYDHFRHAKWDITVNISTISMIFLNPKTKRQKTKKIFFYHMGFKLW